MIHSEEIESSGGLGYIRGTVNLEILSGAQTINRKIKFVTVWKVGKRWPVGHRNRYIKPKRPNATLSISSRVTTPELKAGH